ncbi:fibronectin type III domain-containing protein [Streptomyces justiciae]|uniref:fibronectin type III domain-containing protein n=1 Tax=Streptomyces justiciae TaxID=2780140 RepID=UPI00188039F8|nr:PA14 domain-containing protein [Streptomyces justiciae]MBE8471219.1 cellulose 1,4-beta-cellobiosidase [Streptomyces justiciae]
MNHPRFTTAAAASAVVLATAGTLLTVTPASAATTCNSPVFKRQFFANTTFSGTPKKTDCDSAIDQSWSGAPVSGLPSNNFGVRWSVSRDFGSGGPFSLAASGLDGIRVYVDGVRKIDLWKNTSTTVSKTVNVSIPSGKHSLRVDYVNWTGSAKVKFAYAPRTSATVDKVKPLVPTGTSVSYDQATGKAKLTWSKNKEMDLAGYRVYRRLKGTSFGSTPLATTTGTSYTDATLPVTGDTYYYEIRAYDKAGNVSGGTADQSVTTVDRTAPAGVTGVTAKGTTAGISLTWEASASKDVDHYEVWASRNGDPDPDGPDLVLGTSLQFPVPADDTGVPYAFSVYAVDTAVNVSPVSGEVAASRPVASTAAAPTGLATEPPADDLTKVTWTASPDMVGSYHVYRRTDTQSAWTWIGSTGGEGWEDRTAPAGKAYYYVATVGADGLESLPSEQVSAERVTKATAVGPKAPKLTLVSNGIPGRSAIQVTAAPGAGDEGRLLKGYSWDVSGACGDSGTQFSTTGSISWVAPYNGPCMVTVYAVDYYGRVGYQGASLEFFSGR